MKDDLVRPTSTATEDATAIRVRAGAWVFALFGDALDQRAAEPTDDVIGHLARLERTAELTREESLNICLLQLTAGLDTVTASLECFFGYLCRSQRINASWPSTPSARPRRSSPRLNAGQVPLPDPPQPARVG
jgi:cytochrome P450